LRRFIHLRARAAAQQVWCSIHPREREQDF